ncbi:MAG TPA: PilZ domain-containing protein [Solirubrobacteraceae bacterium]
MAQEVARERRTNPRVAVAVDVSLERKVGNAVSARTRDLSVGGAYVISTRPLQIFEEMHFDLVLDGGEHVDGTARVLRQHQHDAYALRFERVEDDSLRVLSAFLDAHAAPLQ